MNRMINVHIKFFIFYKRRIFFLNFWKMQYITELNNNALQRRLYIIDLFRKDIVAPTLPINQSDYKENIDDNNLDFYQKI